jgi:hypothetical protein
MNGATDSLALAAGLNSEESTSDKPKTLIFSITSLGLVDQWLHDLLRMSAESG